MTCDKFTLCLAESWLFGCIICIWKVLLFSKHNRLDSQHHSCSNIIQNSKYTNTCKYWTGWSLKFKWFLSTHRNQNPFKYLVRYYVTHCKLSVLYALSVGLMPRLHDEANWKHGYRYKSCIIVICRTHTTHHVQFLTSFYCERFLGIYLKQESPAVAMEDVPAIADTVPVVVLLCFFTTLKSKKLQQHGICSTSWALFGKPFRTRQNAPFCKKKIMSRGTTPFPDPTSGRAPHTSPPFGLWPLDLDPPSQNTWRRSWSVRPFVMDVPWLNGRW